MDEHVAHPLTAGLLRAFPFLKPAAIGRGDGALFPQDTVLGGPFGITEVEGLLLAMYVRSCRPEHILEIGSYVGWSTAHLACFSPNPVQAVDNFTEGAGRLVKFQPAMFDRFWENMAACGLDQRVTLVVGTSPDCLASIVPIEGWDFIFLDGWHFDGQPVKDVQGAYRLCLPAYSPPVFCLHDLWLDDVAAAGHWLVTVGYERWDCDTPGEMAFFTHHPPRGWAAFLEAAEEVNDGRSLRVHLSE